MSKLSDFQRSTLPEVEKRDGDWFLHQLRQKVEALDRGKEILILCPFHADSRPSCGVSKIGGFYKCFSCNSGGHWNKLARKLGMTTLKERKPDKTGDPLTSVVEDVSRALRDLGSADPSKREHQVGRPFVKPWDPETPWRDVPGSFLVSLGCIHVYDLRHTVERIGLPVRNVNGVLHGYTCRAINPVDANPKYSPMAADRFSWREKELPVRELLFLMDKAIVENWRTVVLVEGPYDALRLYAAGIPAMALLGAGNWNQIKVNLIAGLGLERVFVFMDNDEAGARATTTVLESLHGHVPAKALKLPKSVKDPGQLTETQLDWVRGKVGIPLPSKES